jgi:hypothetical protein
MYIWIILSVLLLFFAIYFAVRLAIKPLINGTVDVCGVKDAGIYDGLIKLRDRGIISLHEFDKIIQLYEDKDKENEKVLEYDGLLEELNKLRKLEIFSDMEYELKIERVKEYYYK